MYCKWRWSIIGNKVQRSTYLELDKLEEIKKLSRKSNIVTAGYFRIKESDDKITLKLKGDFDINNIYSIKLMLLKKSFCTRFLELDMSEIETISSEALAQLSTTLQICEEREMTTEMTGLEETNLNVSKQ